MNDNYSFVFWINDGFVSCERAADLVCRVESVFEQHIGCPVLNFETALSKNKAHPITISREYMLQKLERMRKTRASSPWFTFGFFSSKDDSKSIGTRFSLGDFNHLFPNTVTIHFPTEYTQNQSHFPALWSMFKELSSILTPYYAFMSNNINHELSEKFWNQKPAYIHTFNFFDHDTMKLIGEEKLLCEANIEVTANGILLKLLSEPLCVENPEHLRLQRETSARLGLI